MKDHTAPKRDLIKGRAALIVIDIQISTLIDRFDDRTLPKVPGYRARM